MTDKIVVLVTAGSYEEADKIARGLVEQQLAACVNLIKPVQSVYRWEGKTTADSEVLLVIKTSRPLFTRVRHVVENLHSYHVPEVLCLPIIDGSPNYLNWLAGSILPSSKEVPSAPGETKPLRKVRRKTSKPTEGKKHGKQKKR